MAEDRAELRLGPIRIAWWRIWLLGAAWALGAGIIAASILLLARHEPAAFDPDSPEAIAVRVKDAATELERGRPEVALARLVAIRAEDPLNPYVHALVGRALGRLDGRLPEAVAATRLAVTLDPLFTDAWYNLACLYGRLGDANGALRALAEAAALGFDDRDGLARDPDLAAIVSDPRVAFFLSRGHLPASLRFAELSFEPPEPRVGEPFDVIVRGWSLDPEASGEDRFDVRFLGPSKSRAMRPMARVFKVGGEPLAGATGWEARFRLLALRPWSGVLGPWEVRIDGKRVAMVEDDLKITLPPGAEGGGSEGPAFDPRAFFSAPWGDVGGPRALPGFEGGWSTDGPAVELAPFPAGGPPAAGALWDGPGPAPASYDEWILPPGEAPPRGLRRVFTGE